MRFDARQVDDVFVVSLSLSRLDAAVAEPVLVELARLIEHRSHVVIDLSSVVYIDLIGFEALLEAIRRCRGKVSLAALSAAVSSLFAIALPPDCLTLADSVPAALERFRAAAFATSAGR